MCVESKEAVPVLIQDITEDDVLWRWIKHYTGLSVPRRAFCRHHQAPFEYLQHSYFASAALVTSNEETGTYNTSL